MTDHHAQLSMFGKATSPSPTTTPPSALLRESLPRIADPLELNPEQLQVVTAPFLLMLVIAGVRQWQNQSPHPTRGLVHRSWHTRRKQILSITFTRKAAHEMLSRVQEINPLPTHKIDGGTFHSKAHHWLRLFGSAIGRPRGSP